MTVKNCELTAHKTYVTIGSAGTSVSMGTYDISATNSTYLTFLECTQTNFFAKDSTVNTSMSEGYWGIAGTNYCKNLTYDTCRLTRFDAHCGVANANILNSEVATISLIGAGTARIENTRVYVSSGRTLLTLRDDYGSTWHGDIIIKDVTMISSSKPSSVNLISISWVNHYFGYTTYLPTTITVDNFVCEDAVTVNIFGGNIPNSDVSAEFLGDTPNNNPYVPTKKVIIRNNNGNYSFNISSSPFFSTVQIIEE